MFDEPGKKLKLVSVIGFWIVAAFGVLSSLIYICTPDSNLLVFFILFLLIPFAAYINSLFLSAFGELVENSSMNKFSSKQSSANHAVLPASKSEEAPTDHS